MASLFSSPTPLSHFSNSPSSSSSSSISHIPCEFHRVRVANDFRGFKRSKWSPIRRRSAVVPVHGQVSVVDEPPPPQGSNSELIASLKLKLLSAISGLNRGLAASKDDLERADYAAKELEAAGGPVDISVDLDKLVGRWKLLYSSAYSSGSSLSGNRFGPPFADLLPITVGQVFQRVGVVSKDLDNTVEMELGAPWPMPPAKLSAALVYKFELIGNSNIKIASEKSIIKN